VTGWTTAKDLADSAPETPPYIIDELLIYGAITEMAAQIKAGKTTFMGAALRAIYDGDPIIGLSTNRAIGLWLSEEGPNTFRSMLVRTNLTDAEDLHVLLKGQAPRVPWPELIEKHVWPKAEELKAGFVIVDTLSRWAGIKADEENQTGAAQEAMAPLEFLRDKGLAVLTLHHERKSGGEVGQSTRGASAWGGAGDILLQLTNPHTNGHPNRRTLDSLGRFSDPGKWTIDLEHGEYKLISTGDMAERDMARLAVLKAVEAGALSKAQLERVTGHSRSTVDRAVGELVREQKLQRMGTGYRNDPHLFLLTI
jgi:hypothetical protein